MISSFVNCFFISFAHFLLVLISLLVLSNISICTKTVTNINTDNPKEIKIVKSVFLILNKNSES